MGSGGRIIKPSTGTQLSLDPKFVCFLSDEVLDFDIDLDLFINSLNFTHSATGRLISYLGDNPYCYGDFYHPAVPILTNVYVAELKRAIERYFPDVIINSALINYYPHKNSMINLHSDDEAVIQSDSYIVTVSLGSPRKLLFTTKAPGQLPIMYVELKNKSVLIFSKQSQGYYKHGILADTDFKGQNSQNSDDFKRVSITFRLIR